MNKILKIPLKNFEFKKTYMSQAQTWAGSYSSFTGYNLLY